MKHIDRQETELIVLKCPESGRVNCLILYSLPLMRLWNIKMSNMKTFVAIQSFYCDWLLRHYLILFYIYGVDNFTTCICGYIQSHIRTYSGGGDGLQKDSNGYQNPQLRHCDQTENPVDCTPDFYKEAPPPLNNTWWLCSLWVCFSHCYITLFNHLELTQFSLIPNTDFLQHVNTYKELSKY